MENEQGDVMGSSEPVATDEPAAAPVEDSAPQEVTLSAEQWQFLHDSFSWSLSLSLASLLLSGAILGAILSFFLGRAVNRG